jgi:hypothetical protein
MSCLAKKKKKKINFCHGTLEPTQLTASNMDLEAMEKELNSTRHQADKAKQELEYYKQQRGGR